jgi:hypothetical protein
VIVRLNSAVYSDEKLDLVTTLAWIVCKSPSRFSGVNPRFSKHFDRRSHALALSGSTMPATVAFNNANSTLRISVGIAVHFEC